MEHTGTLVAAVPIPGSLPNPLGVQVAPWRGVVVIRIPVRPNSDPAEFRSSVVSKFTPHLNEKFLSTNSPWDFEGGLDTIKTN